MPKSVKDITEQEAADIYRTRYWLAGKCDKLPPNLAIAHFDTCVNTGVGQAAKILQRTVGVRDDGAIGPGTLNAVEMQVDSAGDKQIAKEYLAQRRIFYTNLVLQKPNLQVFLKGWLNRVDTLSKYIEERP